MKPEEMLVLVIGPHVWGRGDTLADALKAAGRPKSYAAYVVAPTTFVDFMGRLNFPAEFPPKLFHQKTAAKRRVK